MSASAVMVSARAWQQRMAARFWLGAGPGAASVLAPNLPSLAAAHGSVACGCNQTQLSMMTLKKRSEFLAVAKGGRVDRRAFVLQGLKRPDGEETRVGYTVTKKTGNSAERNRIRRRLRAAIRDLGPEPFPKGADFVLIGRRAALCLPFEQLLHDIQTGLASSLDPRTNKFRSGNRKPKGKRGSKTHSQQSKQG